MSGKTLAYIVKTVPKILFSIIVSHHVGWIWSIEWFGLVVVGYFGSRGKFKTIWKNNSKIFPKLIASKNRLWSLNVRNLSVYLGCVSMSCVPCAKKSITINVDYVKLQSVVCSVYVMLVVFQNPNFQHCVKLDHRVINYLPPVSLCKL